MAASIDIRAAADRRLAWWRGGSVRFITATVTASGETAGPRAALNLGIAVDTSSSMSGGKIGTARRAALALVETLDAADTLTLTAFSETGELLLDHVAMDEDGKAAARRAIDLLEAHGMTNLSEGWLLAAEGVAKAMREGAVSRTVIVTDGHTNQGIRDRGELAAHASALRANGIATSTVGVGDDYDSVLLQALSAEGGGMMHDAEFDREIVEVLEGELKELRALALEAAYITVAVPPGAAAESLGALPATRTADGLRVFMGALGAGASRDLVLKLTLPGGPIGSDLVVRLAAEGIAPGSGDAPAADAEVRFELARGSVNTPQPRDEAVAAIVARTWHADAARRAAALNRQGMRDQAAAWLKREIHFFGRYVTGIQGGADLLAELETMAAGAHRDWDERTRKEIEVSMYKRSRRETDYRRTSRESPWGRL